MVIHLQLFLIFVTLSSITAQTFQYSRGWTNGKRDGYIRNDFRDTARGERDTPRIQENSDDVIYLAIKLERLLSPCQMNKLKHVLGGKSWSDQLLAPCMDVEQPKRYKNEHNSELLNVFQ